MGQVVSSNPLFAAQATDAIQKIKGPNILFNAGSQSTTSHMIEVKQTAVVVKAFGLSGIITISVNMVANDGVTTVTAPLKLNGKVVALDVNNTSLVLDLPGNYTFTLNNGGLGTVSAVILESGMPYWSYGLAAFATAV